MKTTARGSAITRKTNPFSGGSAQEEYASLNDIVLVVNPLTGKKDLSFTSDAEAVRDIVDARVKTIRGEMQLDSTRGIPHFEGVLGKIGGDTSEWECWMRNTIEETDGVSGILEFSVEQENKGGRRQVSYTAKIQTEYGAVDL